VPGTVEELHQECAESVTTSKPRCRLAYRLIMGRFRRNEAPGYHHVVTRGNNKQAIYLDDADRTIFCLTVSRVARKNDWRILAYVLMRNHYHLLISVGERGLSNPMQRLNHSYAVTFNARHSRINHLFGKRYWSKQLTTDAAVQAAARDIIQNPLRAGIATIDGYEWSSYRATLGLEFPRIALATDELLPFFGRTTSGAAAAYASFCREPASVSEVA
jgi:putative transposase